MINNNPIAAFKPSIVRRVFAHLFMLTTITCSCTGAVLAAWVFKTEVTFNFIELVAYIFVILCSSVLGWIVGAFFIWKWLAQIGLLIVGSDFKVGDIVYIVKGAHRGTSAPIYEIWDTRYQVRVFLGEDEKKAVTDVFSYHEIINRNR